MFSQGLRDSLYRGADFLGVLTDSHAPLEARVARFLRGSKAGVSRSEQGARGRCYNPRDVVRALLMAPRYASAKHYHKWFHLLYCTAGNDVRPALYRVVVPRASYMDASIVIFSVAFGKVSNSITRI